MAKIMDFEEYRALVDEVKVHDYKYFALNNPTISDEEYDALYFALQEYEEAHPDEVLKDSPTQQLQRERQRQAHCCASHGVPLDEEAA